MARLVEFFHTGNSSIGAFLGFANSTIVVLSIWMHQTLYLNKYGRRDRLDVYLNIPAMFIIGNFALTFGTSTFGAAEYVQYNVMMILAHTCILLQYYLRGRKEGFNADIKWSMISLGIVITYFVLLFIWGAVFRFYEFAERVTSFIWCLWLISIFIPLVFV